MLAIFDIDGTICDSREVEGRCYADAIGTVTGQRLGTLDWSSYADPTSTGIVRELLRDDPQAAQHEQAIVAEFLRLLHLARAEHPDEFSPVPGVIDFIAQLPRHGPHTVAIASGGFAEEARFKLHCCGIALDAYPHATSGDRTHRSDILALAARRAGFTPEGTVYFGDGPWDIRAAAEAGMRFIGIGRRWDQLRALGAATVFRDFRAPELILRAMDPARVPEVASP